MNMSTLPMKRFPQAAKHVMVTKRLCNVAGTTLCIARTASWPSVAKTPGHPLHVRLLPFATFISGMSLHHNGPRS